MADYFTQFSCVLDVGTPDKAVAALDLFEMAFADQAGTDDGESDLLHDLAQFCFSCLMTNSNARV